MSDQVDAATRCALEYHRAMGRLKVMRWTMDRLTDDNAQAQKTIAELTARAELAEAERDRLQQSLTAVRAELVAKRQQVAALVTGRKS